MNISDSPQNGENGGPKLQAAGRKADGWNWEPRGGVHDVGPDYIGKISCTCRWGAGTVSLSWMGILRYHIRFEFEMDCLALFSPPLLMLGDGLSWASCSYSSHPTSFPGSHWVHVPAQELKAQGITADEAGQHCSPDDVRFFPASFWITDSWMAILTLLFDANSLLDVRAKPLDAAKLILQRTFFPPHDHQRKGKHPRLSHPLNLCCVVVVWCIRFCYIGWAAQKLPFSFYGVIDVIAQGSAASPFWAL